MRRRAPSRKTLRSWMLMMATVAFAIGPIPIADIASAQSMGRGGASVRANVGGYCPTGTCGILGGRMARNLKNCKPEHCRS
jgi:hypothetical protein